jgi:hypothetical protein
VFAIAVSKSPVSLTLGDEVPHIFTRKSRLQPLEFLITGAKRLLQHNRDISGRNNEHREGVAFDPGPGVECASQQSEYLV